ncbi:MAG: hypothetical protein M3R43_04095, partial [Acidobacteriota bacterium]|nr:hypothetical protein [Acidobacteriota bacterium]
PMKRIPVLFAGFALCLSAGLPSRATVLVTPVPVLVTPSARTTETVRGAGSVNWVGDSPKIPVTVTNVSLTSPALPDFGMTQGFTAVFYGDAVDGTHRGFGASAPPRRVSFEGMDFLVPEQNGSGAAGPGGVETASKPSKATLVERSSLVLAGSGLLGVAMTIRRRFGAR